MCAPHTQITTHTHTICAPILSLLSSTHPITSSDTHPSIHTNTHTHRVSHQPLLHIKQEDATHAYNPLASLAAGSFRSSSTAPPICFRRSHTHRLPLPLPLRPEKRREEKRKEQEEGRKRQGIHAHAHTHNARSCCLSKRTKPPLFPSLTTS